jgi:poly(A) polymerase
LLVRYCTTPDGKIERKALLYQADEHQIDNHDIDSDAVRVIKRLKRSGFEAYLVGGAVRDLLIGRKPKDFDIATNALPKQVRKLFSHSRIIGRRFRLVHIYYTGKNKEQKIFEVSTFRAGGGDQTNNIYGTLAEDVWRRDFSLNALFYCPLKQIIIDYVDGVNDIRSGRIRTLSDPAVSFTEDPVRMIRGIKYAAATGFQLPGALTGMIKKRRQELRRCSPERVTEEVYKILASGYAAEAFKLAFRLRLLEVMLPSLDAYLSSGRKKETQSNYFANLHTLDEQVGKNTILKNSRGTLLVFLLGHVLCASVVEDSEPEFIQQELRRLALPLLPSKRELGTATRKILRRRFAPTQFK